MRLLVVVMLGLGCFTGCGEVQEFQNAKVEAVEGGFTVTDESGAEAFASKVEHSAEVGTMALCCKSCVFIPEANEFVCHDCRTC